MEHVDSLHLLACTNKLDWFGNNRTDREGCTTTGITIELGENDTIEIQTIVELLSRIHSILTSHRVNHKESFIRVDGLLQVGDLVHHLLINSQTTSSIDDDNGIALLLSLTDSVLSNLNDILVAFLCIDIHANCLGYNLQLLDSSRTINVTSHQQRFLVLTLLEHLGEFSCEGGLTRTLKTRHKDDGRTRLEFQLYGLTSHQFCQLIMDNLHHQLAWLHGCEHIHTHRLLLHSICERLGYLIVNVGIQQGTTNILKCLSNIDFGDFSLTFKYLKRSF